jgi:hypothetical protein
VALIRERYPQVILIENGRNLGFAEGCNVGIRYLLKRDFELVLLLNNDAEVGPECLQLLQGAAELFPAAAYTATIYEHADREKVWFGGGTINRLTLEARHEAQSITSNRSPRPTEFITGCCLLFRAEALKRIGLLDTHFFAYYEDVDWCLRAKAAGDCLIYVPEASVYHEVSHSFRRAGSINGKLPAFVWAQKQPVVLYLTYRNRVFLAKKHSKSAVRFSVLVARTAIRAVVHAVLLLAIGQRQRAAAVLTGLLHGSIRSPELHYSESYLEKLLSARAASKKDS